MKCIEANQLLDTAIRILSAKSKCFQGELNKEGNCFENHKASIQFSVTAESFGYCLCACCYVCGVGDTIINLNMTDPHEVMLWLDKVLKAYFVRIHGCVQTNLSDFFGGAYA